MVCGKKHHHTLIQLKTTFLKGLSRCALFLQCPREFRDTLVTSNCKTLTLICQKVHHYQATNACTTFFEIISIFPHLYVINHTNLPNNIIFNPQGFFVLKYDSYKSFFCSITTNKYSHTSITGRSAIKTAKKLVSVTGKFQ